VGPGWQTADAFREIAKSEKRMRAGKAKPDLGKVLQKLFNIRALLIAT
jgi:hypothetical protein